MSVNNSSEFSFSADTYIQRRQGLIDKIGSGLILLPGHKDSPMNYTANIYPFRQDSSFLYYFGLDQPGVVGLIDADQNRQILFGDEPSLDAIVFMGPQTPLSQTCRQYGVSESMKLAELEPVIRKAAAQGRDIHYLPPSRPDAALLLGELLGIMPAAVAQNFSEKLIRAVAAQRSVKSAEEVACIEAALEITCQMQTGAMKKARPGMTEYQLAGIMEGLAVSQGYRLAFPTIFTVNGEVLHNHVSGRIIQKGDIAINDSGSEGPMHYASDITRTIPIGGKFDPRQRDIYSLVLSVQQEAIEAVKPGVEFRDIHRLACVKLLEGLKDIGLVKGDCQDAVNAGAHTMFFQCGLGHMMGLDAHDMEGLGEQYVGYTDKMKQSTEFGWRSLRLGKALEPGYVITVEPGVYFIPELIDRWSAEKLHADFINYDMLEQYRDFGGIRIEDDLLVTDEGYRLLGSAIPKSIEQVEALTSE